MICREDPPCIPLFEEVGQSLTTQRHTFDEFSAVSLVSLDLQNEFDLDKEREVFQLFETLELRLAAPCAGTPDISDSTLLNEFNPYRPRGQQLKMHLQNAQYEEWCHFPHFRTHGKNPTNRPTSRLSHTRLSTDSGFRNPVHYPCTLR
eukprot:NODE_6496_length_530_cov_5.858561_g6331_i0.p1 GENE.NODE_6496_length_530_cov_5.858561_g6331_i0~~NODE_6496_length_530_cov_5.858561_g6331_i0.p1  ORF type:complete len:148 (-),score=24.12 NODE_6496_length_530_cov_5.858561_g6331_i0:3-446(-)